MVISKLLDHPVALRTSRHPLFVLVTIAASTRSAYVGALLF